MTSKSISAVIRKYQTEPFEWGRVDCIHFGLEAAAAAGRRDLRSMIPAYSTAIEAMRVLRGLPWPSLIEALDANATPIPSARALPGDVAYLDVAPMGALGTVISADALFLSAEGTLRMPVSGLMIWRP